MRNNMKKIIGVMLTVVVLFTLGIFAHAEDTTLTIKTKTGHTYKIYQLLVGDVSGLNKGSGVLANVTAGAQLKDLNGDGAVDAADVTAFDASIKKADGTYLQDTALASAASKAIKSKDITFSTVTGDDKDQDVTVANGYYIVLDSYRDQDKECAAYMVAVAGPTTMSPKTSTTDIDKNIVDDDANKALETGDSKKTDTAAIGDVINYETTSTVPITEGYKYYYYIVTDTMSTGLTFNKDLVIKIGGEKLDETEYKLTQDDHSFKLSVNDMKKYTAGDAILIKYSATVNKDANIGIIPNTNTTKLIYSNNPENTYDKEKGDEPGPDDVVGETPERVTKTYVTQLTLQKIDADAGIFLKNLQAATFKLEGNGLNDVILTTVTEFKEDAAGEYYKLKDDTYTKTPENDKTADKYASTSTKYKPVTNTTVSSTTEAESGKSCNITATVDPLTGTITFTGLHVGSYTLSETVVPTGYNKCADIKFKITAAQSGATSLAGGDITWASDNTDVAQALGTDGKALGVFETTVNNQKGNLLPSTGGIGTTIFYVIGAILVIFGGVVLVAKRRMSNR